MDAAAIPAPDRIARAVLRIPANPPAVGERNTYRLFNISILLSALRCLLTYIILPVIALMVGVATNVDVTVGIPLAVVALVFDVVAIRRFWLANHRLRWQMTFLYVLVMGFVVALLIGDISKIH